MAAAENRFIDRVKAVENTGPVVARRDAATDEPGKLSSPSIASGACGDAWTKKCAGEDSLAVANGFRRARVNEALRGLAVALLLTGVAFGQSRYYEITGGRKIADGDTVTILDSAKHASTGSGSAGLDALGEGPAIRATNSPRPRSGREDSSKRRSAST